MNQDRLTSTIKSKKILRVIFFLPGGIFIAEVIAMLLVQKYEGPYAITILIDAIITTTLMLPLIYSLSFRPLVNHIAELEQMEDIMGARLKLMQFAVDHTVDELLQEALDEIETLTGSTIGFFHFLEEDQKTLRLQAWSTNTRQSMCKADVKDKHYSVDQAGVWADCVRQGQPILHNDYASLPNRKGMPEGHAPVIRELTVPIQRNDQVVAILGVGNKPQAFTSDDLELVSTFADFAWDVIESKRVEDALRKSEEKFRTLVDWTYDWEQWINPEGNIVYTSPSCERITGYLPKDFISTPGLLVDVVHPDDQDAYKEHIKLVHDETAGIDNVEYRVIARDGTVRWVDHICRPLFGKDDLYLGRRVSNRDITRQKEAEQEISERNDKEIKLSQALHTMQIDIARDLHDTVGQNIGYLRMKLDHLSELDLQTHPDLKSEIKNMSNVADESYDLIRGTLAVLHSGGLVDPLTLFTRYANQIEERSPFKVNVSSQGEPRALSPNQVRQLFFVYREALSNIEKHANASHVTIKLLWADDRFILRVVDNGRGIRMEDKPARSHYGLRFMHERIKSLNGVFSIQTANGNGTNILITLPYNPK